MHRYIFVNLSNRAWFACVACHGESKFWQCDVATASAIFCFFNWPIFSGVFQVMPDPQNLWGNLWDYWSGIRPVAQPTVSKHWWGNALTLGKRGLAKIACHMISSSHVRCLSNPQVFGFCCGTEVIHTGQLMWRLVFWLHWKDSLLDIFAVYLGV